MATVAGVLLTAIGVAILTVMIANARARPHWGALRIERGASRAAGPKRGLAVMTWNIGFAGLGANGVVDATSAAFWRPDSASTVARNADAIVDLIGDSGAEIVMVQEDAKAGYLTRNIDVHSRLAAAMQHCDHCYWRDIYLMTGIGRVSVDHGLALFSSQPLVSAASVSIPQDNVRLSGGVLKKFYGALAARIAAPGNRNWVLINLHLSAFDSGGAVRVKQLQSMLKYARAAHAEGDFVVMGGDFNMAFAEEPNATPARGEPESTDVCFPMHLVPDDWGVHYDPNRMSVRDTARPIREREPGTWILDAFITSPNVVCSAIETRTTGFAMSDHQPVIARFEISE